MPAITAEQFAAISRFPDQNPNPVLRVTGGGRLMYANRASETLVAAFGARVGDPVPDSWLERIRAAARTGAPFEVPDGARTFEVLAVDVPEFGVVNLYGTEITARKAIVKFPDQNPNPVFRLDWDGRVIYANPASLPLIAGLGCKVGGLLRQDLRQPLLALARAGEAGTRHDIESGGRVYELSPVDVPEFGFVNVYGTDITASRELAKLHRENERLLLNILPEPIADRLRRGERLIADRFDDVTLLFADIVGFTELSGAMQPEELVTMLNDQFTIFDELVDLHGLEKVKTIGDAYMVIGGLLEDSTDHTERVARMALDLSDRMEATGAAEAGIRFRIGINCGPVVAGVIGTKKFIYDVWGDTVNLASRMESTGVPGRIQVSAAVEARLRGRFDMEPRGLIEVKGKGQIATWFLTGSR